MVYVCARCFNAGQIVQCTSNACICIYTVYVYTNIIYIRIYIYVYINIIYICIYIYVYININILHIHTQVEYDLLQEESSNTYIYIHTYIHTYACTGGR